MIQVNSDGGDSGKRSDVNEASCPNDGIPLHKCGVVAVIGRGGKLLLIRRSNNVAAPGKYCFPGGAIEAGETQEMALVRELQEELGVEVEPVRPLWESLTPWGVHLVWWKARLTPEAAIKPNPREVAEVLWMKPGDAFAASDLLESNRQFMEKVLSGEISLDLDQT